MPHIIARQIDRLLHISFNRPEVQNRFTMPMLADLGRMLREADDNPAVGAILLTGNGPDFCAGGDVAILPAWKQGVNPIAPSDINPTGLNARKLTKPLITIVQGVCFSGGLELALASDVCIAADSARFAFEEMRYATFPFAGAVFRFVRAAGRSNALRYVFTSEEFDAQEAWRMNVVAAVKPLREASEYGLTLATRISHCAPLAVRATLAQVAMWANHGDAAALENAIAQEIVLLNSEDCAEGIRAMLEKRAPAFAGK